MESFQQPPILPSNAPPWPELDDSPNTKELRGCSNLQIAYDQPEPTPDYLDGVSDDSTNAPSCGRLGSMVSYSQPSHMHSQTYDWMSPNVSSAVPFRKYGRHGGMSRADMEENQAEQNARLLASRFARCEGYIKYRNRQPKEKKTKDDQKWPDHIEDAFLRALCRWEPCGRGKKVPPGGTKLMGRNELIADYILTHTGESRTRKQVSSHIQVLKPFVLKERMIMRYLATPPSKLSQAAKLARKGRSAYNPEGRLKKDIANRCSNYTLQALLNLQPEEFDMYMRRIDSKQERIEIQATTDASNVLHTYSSTNNSQPGMRKIRDQVEMYEHFPELTTLPIDRFKYGKFLALQVPITLHEPRQLGRAELAISFVFKAPAFNPSINISSRTRLYKDGIPFSYDAMGSNATVPTMNFGRGKGTTIPYDECKGEGIEFGEELASSASQLSQDTENQQAKMVRYYVPFSSKFWADYLWRTALSHHSATHLESQVDQAETSFAAARDKRKEVTAALSGLSAVQEIVASSSGCDPQVVLTVHFKFSHAALTSSNTTWQFLELASVFSDAVDSSNSGSQESAYSGNAEAYCGSGGDTLAYDLDYTDTGSKNDGLSSPVALMNDTGANYNTSWVHSGILPVTTNGVELGVSPILDTFPRTFNFMGSNNAMSLDTTQEFPATASAPYSLEMELATEPLMLPSQGTAEYDYAEFFDRPHDAPRIPGLQAQKLEQLVSQVDIPFQMQAFAGADTTYAHGTDTETSFFPKERDVIAGVGIEENSFGGQNFGFRHLQESEHDTAYLHSRPHESFSFEKTQSYPQVQDSFALPPQRQASFAPEHDFSAHTDVQPQGVFETQSQQATHGSFGQVHHQEGFEFEQSRQASRDHSQTHVHGQQGYGDDFELGEEQSKGF